MCVYKGFSADKPVCLLLLVCVYSCKTFCIYLWQSACVHILCVSVFMSAKAVAQGNSIFTCQTFVLIFNPISYGERSETQTLFGCVDRRGGEGGVWGGAG